MFLSGPGWEECFEKGYSSVGTHQWFFSHLCRSIRFYFLLCHHATFLTLLAIPDLFYCRYSHSLNRQVFNGGEKKAAVTGHALCIFIGKAKTTIIKYLWRRRHSETPALVMWWKCIFPADWEVPPEPYSEQEPEFALSPGCCGASMPRDYRQLWLTCSFRFLRSYGFHLFFHSTYSGRASGSELQTEFNINILF